MSETTIRTGEVWPIDKVHLWDKNPRHIGPEDFDRLKAQIKKLGVYKPLIVTAGGNMRYRALKELGQKEVWVSIVEPKSDAEMLEFALSDNDRAGSYDRQKLAEMATLLPVETKLYKLDVGRLLPLEDLKKEYGPDGNPDPPEPPKQGNSTPTFGRSVVCPSCGENFEVDLSSKEVRNA